MAAFLAAAAVATAAAVGVPGRVDTAAETAVMAATATAVMAVMAVMAAAGMVGVDIPKSSHEGLRLRCHRHRRMVYRTSLGTCYKQRPSSLM